MLSCAVSRLVILLFGTLYPAYASYKAVKSKNVKEYVKWMMYWIVFALFTSVETFTDVFLAFWFPFYYEIKIVLVLWLLSPATRGSSVLYRKFVHPQLAKREKDIDEYIVRAREHGYHAVLQLGSKGINYASHVLVQTALKGGGHVVNQLQRSYSLGHLETQEASAAIHDQQVTYQRDDQSDHADTGAEDESFPIDDLSEQQTLDIRAVESEPEVNLQRLTSSTRGRSRKGDAPSSGYSSTENLSTSAPSGVGVDRRPSTRTKGGRPTYTNIVNQPSMQTKKSRTEIGSSATLPRAKRSTRRRNTTTLS